MCGRFAITSAPDILRALLRYREQPNFPPRFNVTPTQPIPIVREARNERHFALVRWGLLPSWIKDPKGFTLLINARGETVNEKPAFRNAMKYRRCLIPADGFYEWKGEGAGKRPYFARLADASPFCFAGLWEAWTGPNGEEMESAAIVTTAANRTLMPIHHRMPVMLRPAQFAPWLDCAGVNAQEAAAMLAPLPDEAVAVHPVSDAVNRTVNDDPGLIAPVAEADTSSRPSPEPQRRKALRADDRQASLF